MLIIMVFVRLPFHIMAIMWVIKRLCPHSVPKSRRQQLEITELAKLTQEVGVCAK